MKKLDQTGMFDFRLLIAIPGLMAMVLFVTAEYSPHLIEHLNGVSAPNPEFTKIYHQMFSGWQFWTGMVGLGLFWSLCELISLYRKGE